MLFGWQLLAAAAEMVASTKVVQKLGRFRATAIAGNDLTASCLYTAGVCIAVVRD